MRITQGTFSYLPDLTDDEITAQVQYALDQGWPLAVEFTDDPHPRNTYWEMWGLPMFDLHDAAGVMQEIAECRKAYPGHYVRVNALRRVEGPADDRAVVHRQPPGRGTRLPARPAGDLRPPDPLHDARLRDRAAGRQPLRFAVTAENGQDRSTRPSFGMPGRPASPPPPRPPVRPGWPGPAAPRRCRPAGH